MGGAYKPKPRHLWKVRVLKLDVQARRDICTAYQAGSSLLTLAQAYGVSRTAIRHHLINAGIQMRPKGHHYR